MNDDPLESRQAAEHRPDDYEPVLPPRLRGPKFPRMSVPAGVHRMDGTVLRGLHNRRYSNFQVDVANAMPSPFSSLPVDCRKKSFRPFLRKDASQLTRPPRTDPKY